MAATGKTPAPGQAALAGQGAGMQAAQSGGPAVPPINQVASATAASTPNAGPSSAAPPTMNGAGGAGNDDNSGKKRKSGKPGKKLLGVDRKYLLVASGLFAFLILGGAGLFISRQFQTQDSFAPTEPKADSTQANCTLSWTVGGPETPEPVCDKLAYQDELSNSAGSYQLITEQSVFEPGETVVYALDVSLDGAPTVTLTDLLDDTLTFLDSNCGENAYNSTTDTLTCTVTPQLTQIIFRATIGEAVANDTQIQNTADLAASGTAPSSCSVTVTVSDEPVPSPTPSPSPSVSPSPTPSVSPSPSPTPTPTPSPSPDLVCGDECTSNSQCPGSHSCYNGRCAYDPCLDFATYECSQDLCTITPDEPEEPVLYCNDECVTNADCSVSNHICYNGRCRLDVNPNSANCTLPANVPTPEPVVYTPVAQAPDQPVLPETLPETGSDTIQIMMAAGALFLVGGLLLVL